MQPYRENAGLTAEDVDWTITKMQLSQLGHMLRYDQQRELAIRDKRSYSQASETLHADALFILLEELKILEELKNKQKKTSPNQVPSLFVNSFNMIFKQLDALIEQELLTDANPISNTMHTLANMATNPLVQQAIVNSGNLSILKKILIHTILNEQHSTVQGLTDELKASISSPSPVDDSASSPSTAATEEYSTKTHSP